ncbi:zinc finger, CCHC-type containing protein [Tanacetum coccineum]
MKDLGEAAFILGIKIYRDRTKRLIRLSKSAYMDKILKRFRMDNSKVVISSFYGGNPEAELRVDCYCDAGFETDRDDIKSQRGYVFVLNGEAEYIAASEAAMEAVWIRKFISGLSIVPAINEPIKMFCDNSATLLIANEPKVQRDGYDATVEQLRKRAKWDNDDYVCRGLILNDMSDSLFNIYQSVESSKELWDSFEAKYMAEDASSRQFLEELTLVELGSHLRIKKPLKVQDSDKPKGNNVVGPLVVNLVEHNNSSRYNNNKGKRKHHDNTRDNFNKKAKPTCWKCGKTSHIKRDCKGVNFGNKANGSCTKGSDDDVAWWVDSGATVYVCKDRCWFKTYESLNDGSILHMRNESTALLHERGCVDLRFCYVYLLHNKNEALDKFKVFKTEVELQQGSLMKRFRTDRGGTRDEVSDQHSYCFNVEDEPKTFDEAMKSQNVAFWKEAINDEMNSIMAFLNGELDEEVYMNQPQGFIIPGNKNKVCKLIKSLYGLKQAPKQWHQKFNEVIFSNGYLLNQANKCVYSKFDESGKGFIICLYVDDMLVFGTDQFQVDLTKEFLSSRFSMKYMGEADVILGIRVKHESNGIAISQSHYIKKVPKKFNFFDCTPVSTPMDTSDKLVPNNGQAVSQLEYSRVIACLMYSMTCIRPDIAFTMDKLSRYTSNSGTQHWQAIQQINNSEDNSSTSGWVFLLAGGVISWASKKQTCITGSTMESELMLSACCCMVVEWLKNLLLEIPLWSKPIAPISIRCDSAATLAKAYSQMYNVKSRHLGVRHNMIRELITNGVVSIEFVRSQRHLADHLIKGLARDLVLKSVNGMGLKSN